MKGQASLLLLAVAWLDAGAQRTTASVHIGATNVRYADTIASSGVALSPMLRYAGERNSIDAGGTLSTIGSGLSAQGAIGGSVFLPAWRAFSAELGGRLGGSVHEDGGRTGQTLASLRGHVMRERLGAWAGGGLGTMWDGGAWRAIRQGEAGSWMTLGPTAALVVSATPTVVDDTIKYVDAQTALALSMRRAQVDLSLGMRAGSRLPSMPGSSRVWGGATLTAPVTPRASAVIAAGTYPLDFTQGFPAGRYVSVSLRLSGRNRTATTGSSPSVNPSAGVSGFTMQRNASGAVVMSITAPSAASVEITGDFTQWEAWSMTGTGSGRFVITLPVTAGTYQMNVRVDGGAWVVPQGLTVIRDELGNNVGIVVIPDR